MLHCYCESNESQGDLLLVGATTTAAASAASSICSTKKEEEQQEQVPTTKIKVSHGFQQRKFLTRRIVAKGGVQQWMNKGTFQEEGLQGKLLLRLLLCHCC